MTGIAKHNGVDFMFFVADDLHAMLGHIISRKVDKRGPQSAQKVFFYMFDEPLLEIPGWNKCTTL